MTVASVSSGESSSISEEESEVMAQLGSRAVFQIRPVATMPHILTYMERRDRAVLLLLNGQRTLGDIARLMGRNELEVAQVLVRLLRRGYIEFMSQRELVRMRQSGTTQPLAPVKPIIFRS